MKMRFNRVLSLIDLENTVAVGMNRYYLRAISFLLLCLAYADVAIANTTACNIISKSTGFAAYMRQDDATAERAVEILLRVFTTDYDPNSEVYVRAAVEGVYELSEQVFQRLLPLDGDKISQIEANSLSGCLKNTD